MTTTVMAENMGERIIKEEKVGLTMAEMTDLRDQVKTLEAEKQELIEYAQELKGAFEDMDTSLNEINDKSSGIPLEPSEPACMG